MKTNFIPSIVMLFAGAVYCLFGIYTQVPLFDFTIQLLIVLVVFFILGSIIRMLLDKFMGEIKTKTETEKESEGTVEEKETEEKEATEEENSDEEEGM